MESTWKNKDVELYLGDCLEVMKGIPDNSIDSIITDPPYGLEFMGKDWDKGIPGILFWKEMLRIAKPGATLLAMGGTRTYHRLVCAIEDAGWEIFNTIGWIFGSGFPKSHNISKAMDKKAGVKREILGTKADFARDGAKRNPDNHDVNGTQHLHIKTNWDSLVTAPSTQEAKLWDGWGTALKPAIELICVAQKPREGTYVENALKWGVAGYWIDGARVEHDEPIKHTKRTTDKFGRTHAGGNGWRGKPELQNMASPAPAGRWPANLIHDGSDEVLELMPNTKSGEVKPGHLRNVDSPFVSGNGMQLTGFGDSGSAARFFYCAKASKSERNMGLDNASNEHPTVKPVALMEYLAKLTKTPTGGVVLDPFMGSGTTGIGCVNAGRKFIGIEINEEYFEIAKNRIAEAQLQTRMEI